ncbi:hypothetical protein Tco_0633409 [Tanacetum coccineum]
MVASHVNDYLPPQFSRGLCAPHDVGKGEMLFMVPKSALMTSHSLMKNEDKMQTGISIIEGLGNHHQNEPSCGPSQYAEEATSVYGTFLDEPKQVYTMVIERLSMQIENEYKFVDKEYRGAGHSYITWAANPGRAQGSRRLKTNCEQGGVWDAVKITEDAAKITGIMFTASELLPSEI